jgi:hypothetical protein
MFLVWGLEGIRIIRGKIYRIIFILKASFEARLAI